MSRTRTRTIYRSGTVYDTYYSPPRSYPRTQSAVDSVTDTVHPYPFSQEGDLKITTTTGQALTVNGLWYKNLYNQYRYENYPLNWGGPMADAAWWFPLDAWKTHALSKIQLSGPILDLPDEIAQLKDIPGTIKSLYRPRKLYTFDRRAIKPLKSKRIRGETRVGNLKFESASDLYLTQVFGIEPIVRDVVTLLNLQREIAQRAQMLRARYRSSRAHGALPQGAIFDWYYAGSGGTDSPFLTFKWSNQWEISHKAWYSARLTPVTQLSEALERVALNPLNLHGLSISAVWDLIPWSFLVDYFADVGDFIAAQTNAVNFHVDSLCLMCTTEARVKSTMKPGYYYPGLTYTGGDITYRVKHRWVEYNPSPWLAVSPLLTGSQLANIVALVTTGNRSHASR